MEHLNLAAMAFTKCLVVSSDVVIGCLCERQLVKLTVTHAARVAASVVIEAKMARRQVDEFAREFGGSDR
jgi:hypothetical protein